MLDTSDCIEFSDSGESKGIKDIELVSYMVKDMSQSCVVFSDE